MSGNSYKMAKRINDPATLIIWSVHWVFPIFMGVGAGFVFDQVLLFSMFGMGWFIALRFVEARFPKGYLAHLIWWHLGVCPGFIDDDKPSVPNPMRKEFTQL